ncbi:MAG: peptide ABC transporter substrate-binding protein [Chloroflexi bacterium]|nr:peptide ABC transporter substrate-binding protein [Chloroflexota bacterium]
MRTRRDFGRAFVAVAAGGAMVACQANPFAQGSDDQPLRTFLWNFDTLDPAFTTGALEAEYVVHLFSGLTSLNEKLEVVPDLAEKWTVSNDGRIYTFSLRRGAKFHDGRAITASDVKFSIERAADPRLASPVALTYLGDIQGFAARMSGQAAEVSGIKVRDDITIDITLDEPRVYFPAKLTYPVSYVVDKQNVGSRPDWWLKPNGSGPFSVAGFAPGERLSLVRHDAYVGVKPSLVGVEYLAVPPVEAYERDVIDIAVVDLADIDRVTDKSDPLNRELRVRTDLDIQYVAMNVTAKPFDDPKVRQAFNHALDRDRIATVTLKRTVIKADGILPPAMPGKSDRVRGLDFDVSRARQLVSESSYRDARNFPEISLTVMGTRTAPAPEVNAIIATYRQSLGVDVRVRQLDRDAFMAATQRDRDRPQMFMTGWIADYADPQNFLDILFHSRSRENMSRYANPDIDRDLEKARAERDPAVRTKLYQDIEARILQDAPWVPLWHNKRYILVKPWVQGYTAPSVVQPWLKSVSLKGRPALATPTAPTPTTTARRA